MPNYLFKTYGVGAPAYLDAFIAGLVPVKVIEILPKRIIAKVTRTTKYYSVGTIVDGTHDMIFPHDRLFYRGIYARINTQYEWKNDNEKTNAKI